MAAEHVERMGARIAERRREQRLSQRELADLIPGKADGNQISKWERGSNRPNDQTLEHIATALGVTTEYFLAPPSTAPSPDLRDVLAPSGTDDLRAILLRLEAKVDALHAAVSPTAGDPADEVLSDAERRHGRPTVATTPADEPASPRRLRPAAPGN